MRATSWYTSKPAVVLYHVLTWLVILFLPYIMRTYLDEKREAGFGQGRNLRFLQEGVHSDTARFHEGQSRFNEAPGAPPPMRYEDWRSSDSGRVDNGRPEETVHPEEYHRYDDRRNEDRRRSENWRRNGQFQPRPMMDPKFFSYLAMVLNLAWVALFYINAYWLIPKYIQSKKWITYALIQVAVFVVLSFVVARYLQWHLGETHLRAPMPLLLNIFPYFFVQACSLAYRLIMERIQAEKLQQNKENEGLKTELSFLRSQISPHFIFNVLNNMVSLARKKSDQLEPGLIRLSGLLRYMLYESDETKVKLSRELDYLRSYIELQSLRFGDDVNLQVELKTPPEEFFIEPMLLIPFVENAFKHSASYLHRPLIEVKAEVTNGVLHFTVVNQYEPGTENSSADKVSGIGLANVARRLNLLYGSRHELLISGAAGFYRISLQITLA